MTTLQSSHCIGNTFYREHIPHILHLLHRLRYGVMEYRSQYFIINSLSLPRARARSLYWSFSGSLAGSVQSHRRILVDVYYSVLPLVLSLTASHADKHEFVGVQSIACTAFGLGFTYKVGKDGRWKASTIKTGGWAHSVILYLLYSIYFTYLT